ncbi:MAG: bifunctional diaminohydroxyphosphoribosylaminopyrimidine deaminase/5-amino-6-(5-phosphoribosylamino)uracil reductase RibD [Clostridium sp.]|nr:bifunctional diaminohydroxyphosphoribosylaminopyrimidine deaminase/5-amino-6-(5-phosphoribosylamino)uracil reductase RibD [Clostridium sp.]
MERALRLARHGMTYAHPNPVVGAVIVGPDGKILGEGYHRKCGEAHAEVNAINAVADKEALKDSTMYVTLEPCSHTGKTGPCADLIIKMGIPRVVVGVKDPFPAVAGRGIERMRQAGIEVVEGFMEKECAEMNAMFITAHSLGRPYILLKWAQSSDGFIDGRHAPGEPPTLLSSPFTQVLVHRLRSHFDAILVGSGTVLSDDPHLSTRYWTGPSPRPVVLDRRGRVGGNSYIMKRNPIIVREDRPLEATMRELYEKYGITNVMVEGGAQVLQSFIDEDLWDLARVETSPITLGDYGSVKAPETHFQIPVLTRNIDGHYVNYYSHNALNDAKNI